ncbi:hypothetical protein ONZ45_g8150 [Pleurotus djamor]|nr:hypothetical protein ONZ45_g8150 [Pleurotus djamor]
MSFATNHNYADGIINNVAGEQRNYSFNQGALILFAPQPIAGQTISAHIPSDSNHRYTDVLFSISTLCEQLCDLMRQPFSPGFFLQAVADDLRDFARTIVLAAKALDIIDSIPGRLKYLKRFKDVPNFLRSHNTRLQELRGEIESYNNHIIQLNAPPGFWTGLMLYVYAYYGWDRLSSEIGGFVKESQRVLENLMGLLSSHHWRSLVPEYHGKQLEQLVLDAGLTPTVGIYHIQMQKILVRDHIGRYLPIPLEFCTSWADLGIIINHFCQGVEGSELILRNDWELIEPSAGTVVKPSQFNAVIKPDLELEMSVVLNRLLSTLFACPGCGYDNPRQESADGWITCYKCDKTFRVTTTMRKPSGDPFMHPVRGTPTAKEEKISEKAPSVAPSQAPTRLQYFRSLFSWNSSPQKAKGQTQEAAMKAKHSTPRPSQSEKVTDDDTLSEYEQTEAPEITKFRRVSIRWFLDGKIKVGEHIGSGGYALVHAGELHEDNSVHPISLKIFYAGIGQDHAAISKRAYREIRIIQGVSHPNLLKFRGLYRESLDMFKLTDNIPALVSDLCEGGTIMTYLADNPTTWKVPLMSQASLGIEYLHHNHILHGDMKPVKAVVADFGRSRVEGRHGYTTKLASSYLYTAPELMDHMGLTASSVPGFISEDGSQILLTPASDIYSFGLTLLTVISGKHPFYDKGLIPAAILLGHKNQRPKRRNHTSAELSDAIWDLICACWQPLPEDRVDAKHVADSLWHAAETAAS